MAPPAPLSWEPIPGALELPFGSAGPCEARTEQAVFSRLCHAEISSMDRMLARTRHRRGLAIRWAHEGGTLGFGSLLQVIFQIHSICLNLRRFCYIMCATDARTRGHDDHKDTRIPSLSFEQSSALVRHVRRLVDSDLEHFFGFANGDLWAFDESEFRKYNHTVRRVMPR
ncbi:MAG: hypothetical protein SGPRY_002481, partial [Prymnesium sp.]